MKIAWLSFYSGQIERGVEVWVDEVAKRLAKKHEVWVFSQKAKGLKGRRAEELKSKRVEGLKDETRLRPARAGLRRGKGGYQVVEVAVGVKEKVVKGDYTRSKLRRFFLDVQSRAIFKFTRRCLPILRREKFDIVVPTNGGWQTAMVRVAQLRGGWKTVVAGQSGPGWDDRWNLKWRPDAFVTLTEAQKKWARSVGFNGRLVKIPNGVDVKKFNPKVKPVKLNLEKPVVVCVGALVASKRIELAINAVSRMKKGSLVVLGAGELKPKLASLGYKLLGERRFKLAQVAHEGMPGYYAAGDVFTIPTVASESFGIVFVETMACGNPVVAPDDEIRREIVGSGGLFVDVENTDAYARTMEEAAAKKWGSKPRKQAMKFSWEKVARGYEGLFKQLV